MVPNFCKARTIRSQAPGSDGDAMGTATTTMISSWVNTMGPARGTKCSSRANEGIVDQNRRSVFASLATAIVTTAGTAVFPNAVYAEAETMERGGVALTPFNSLSFNYRGE